MCASGATRLQYFYEILSVCIRVQVAVSFKFLVWCFSGDKQPSYKHFPVVGAFSTNFQQPLTAKLLIGSKKVSGVQKWYGPTLSPCQVWWRSWVARRLQTKKCDVFLFVTGTGRPARLFSAWPATDRPGNTRVNDNAKNQDSESKIMIGKCLKSESSAGDEKL